MPMPDVRPLARADRDAFTAMFPPYFAEIAPQIPVPDRTAIARWWTDPDRKALTLHVPEIAGFVLIRHLQDGAHELSEFYIVPARRRRGLGRRMLTAVLPRFPGRWQLGLAAGSAAAKAFWSPALAACPNVGHIRTGPPLLPQQSESLHFIVEETL